MAIAAVCVGVLTQRLPATRATIALGLQLRRAGARGSQQGSDYDYDFGIVKCQMV